MKKVAVQKELNMVTLTREQEIKIYLIDDELYRWIQFQENDQSESKKIIKRIWDERLEEEQKYDYEDFDDFEYYYLSLRSDNDRMLALQGEQFLSLKEVMGYIKKENIKIKNEVNGMIY
jgi:hypothetical protein